MQCYNMCLVGLCDTSILSIVSMVSIPNLVSQYFTIYESVQLYDCAIVVTLVVCQDGGHFRIAEEGESCASA